MTFVPASASWKIVGTSYGAEVPSTSDKAVAYISSTHQYFTTIESAVTAANKLANASNPQTVYVIPDISSIQNMNGTYVRRPIEIKHDFTVGDYVTLALPYSGETTSENPGNFGTDFSDSNQSLEATKLKTEVLLGNIEEGEETGRGVVMTIEPEGKLIVGGQIGTQTLTAGQGMTTGLYSQITLASADYDLAAGKGLPINELSGASIVSYGDVVCYGYIKPEAEDQADDGGSSFRMFGGNLEMPLAVYDFPGGNATAGMYYGSAVKAMFATQGYIFPLNVFDFPNISCPSFIHYGASVNVNVSLWINTAGKMVSSIVPLISSGGSGIFNMNSSNSYLKYDYNPHTCINGRGYTKSDRATASTAASPTKIDIYGGANLSNISVNNIDLPIVGVRTLSTQGIFMPFSYKFDINLVTGNYRFPVLSKFLPGCSVRIEKDAAVTLFGDTIFYPNGLSAYINGGYAYPKNLPAAKFVNNGRLYVGASFGGYVETEAEGAVISFMGNYWSASSLDASGNVDLDSNIMNNISTGTTSRNATADIISNASFSENHNLSEVGNYVFVSEMYDDGRFGFRGTNAFDVSISREPWLDGTTDRTTTYEIYHNGVKVNGMDITLKVSIGDTIEFRNISNAAYIESGTDLIDTRAGGSKTFTISTGANFYVVPPSLLNGDNRFVINIANTRTKPAFWGDNDVDISISADSPGASTVNVTVEDMDGSGENAVVHSESVDYGFGILRVGDLIRLYGLKTGQGWRGKETVIDGVTVDDDYYTFTFTKEYYGSAISVVCQLS